MVYVILNWVSGDWETIGTVKEDCEVLVFDSEAEATKYAEDELNFEWKIIEVS